MALKPCRECKRDVSTEAKSCPHCGVTAPTKQPVSKTGWVVLGLFAVVCTAAVRGGDKQTTADTSDSQEQLQMGAAAVAEPVPEPTPAPPPPPFAFSESERKVLEILIADDLKVFLAGGDALARRYPNLVDGRVVVTADKLQRTYDANEVAGDQAYRRQKLLVTGVVDSIKRSIGDNHYITFRGGTNMFSMPNASMARGHTGYLASLGKGQKITLACTGDGMLMGSAMLEDCVPFEAWTSHTIAKIVERVPNAVAAKDESFMGLVTMTLAADAVAPADSPCWKKGGSACLKELSKVKKQPELRTQIATRLGMPEDDVKRGGK